MCKSQGKNAMGKEKSDQCKRLDETECGKAREKKKLREHATNVENEKWSNSRAWGEGGGVNVTRPKGEEKERVPGEKLK